MSPTDDASCIRYLKAAIVSGSAKPKMWRPTAGVNVRLHWIPEAGCDVYFVINYNAEDFDRDNEFRYVQSDLTTTANYMFRF